MSAVRDYTCRLCGAVRRETSAEGCIECLDCDGAAWATGHGVEPDKPRLWTCPTDPEPNFGMGDFYARRAKAYRAKSNFARRNGFTEDEIPRVGDELE